MKFRALLITAVFLTASLATAGSALANEPDLAPHVAGQLLIGFRDGETARKKVATHSRQGSRLLKRFDQIGVDLVRIPPGQSVSAARSRYRSERSVKFADPNYYRYVSGVIPNDPDFAKQWGHRNTGQTVNGDPGISDADIDASESSGQDAWSIQTGTAAPIIAVVDTGVDITHPDLSANIWRNPGEIPGNSVDDDGNGYVDDINGWDFANNDASVYDQGEVCGSSPNDDHGTHVAGIAGAVGNNATGITGVNWRVSIMPLKFIRKLGSECGLGADADAIEAILYAAGKGADVINASWGGGADNNAVRQAFVAAGQGGVLFAAAAGNSGANLATSRDYPSSWDLENEIVVAASTNDDQRSFFSNYGGPTDLAAPGSTIYSTITSGSYAYFSGTSMAAPFVSGAIALLRAQYPEAGYLELKDRILDSVDPNAAFAFPNSQTGGRLNIDKALRDPRPVIPSVISPDGGEVFLAGSTQTVTWRTNVPSDNPASPYRVEYTTNAAASTTFTSDFESGLVFSEPADSESPWFISSTDPHSGSFAARSGGVGADEASWMSTARTLSTSGQVSFWYRTSSENCESVSDPICGDYLRFYVDGALLLQKAGIQGWSFVSFPVSAGEHTFSWAYQKDPLCPPEPECGGISFGEDAVWVDDVTITGVGAATWSLIGTTSAGATSTVWSVPSTETSTAKVRVCADMGSACTDEQSDESNSTFAIEIPAPGVLISQSSGSTSVTEGGSGDSYTVVLATSPSANVTVSINPGTQLLSVPAALTFTSSSWSTSRTIEVSAVDDDFAEGIHAGTITHSASSADPDYNGISIDSVDVTITDNETTGVLLSESDGSTSVTEGASGDSYAVRLLSPPTSNVTVTMVPGDQVVVSPGSLVFTTVDWSTPKSVSVEAVDDGIDEIDPHFTTIDHTVSSSDASYDAAPVLPVEVEIHDPPVQVLPEGATHSGFTTFVLLSNPSASEQAVVKIVFLGPDGPIAPAPSFEEVIVVGPQRRLTVPVNSALTGAFDVSTLVESLDGPPVVAEVSMHKTGSLASVDMTGTDTPGDTWILPEGVTHSGFTTFVTVANPEPVAATVDVTFLTGTVRIDGPQDLVLAPKSRKTINVNSELGAGHDVSTKVVAETGEVVAAVSVHKFDGGDLAIGGSLGVPSSEKSWVVAEGATHSGFTTFVLIANPSISVPAKVSVKFLTPSGAVDVPSLLDIQPGRRITIAANDYVPSSDVSTLVNAVQGSVAVESSIHKLGPQGFVIGDSVASGGADATSASGVKWLVAEGAAHSGFTTFILIANPLPDPAEVKVTFFTSTRLVNGPVFVIPAGTRKTITLNEHVPGADSSTLIETTSGFVVVEMSIDRELAGSGASKGRSLAFKL